MAHSSTVISAPVTMPTDFSAVLGIAGTDLQTNNMSGVINKWAKFKPIPYAEVGILTDAQRASQNYGIFNIPTWSNINKMANFVFGIAATSTNAPDVGIQSVYWAYRPPTGGLSEPFRLADWSNEAKTLGYYHEAEAPIGGASATSFNIDSSGHLRISFNNGAQAVETIKLDELTYPTAGYDIGNMYFGVIMKKQGTSTVYAVTSHKIDDIPVMGAFVDISGLTTAYNGNWDIVPIASADQISFTSSLGQLTNGKFVAFNTEPETVGIGTTVVRMNVMANTLYAVVDTSRSTRLLYTGCTIENVNSPQGSANVVFEAFDENNNSLGSNLRTVSGMNIGATLSVTGAIDLQSVGVLQRAFTVSVIVTPTNVSNYGTSSDAVMVVHGPTPYA